MRKYDTYLVGYYGMENAGDDALMLSALHGIRSTNEHAKVLISSSTEIKSIRGTTLAPTLSLHQAFRGQNRLKNYWNAFRSNAIVFGGGSVLHNSHDLKIKMDMVKLCGGDFSRAAGVSIGPFVDSEAESHCAALLNKLDFVGVRDQQSYDIAQSIAPHANCKLTFDLAPALVTHPDFKASTQDREGVLVNVCPVARTPNGDFDYQADAQRIAELAEGLKTIYQQTGEKISVISLNANGDFGDDILCNMLIEKLGNTVPCVFIPYHHDTLNFIKVISSFKICISMRLHGNVFAYMTGTPSFSLNYHPKCEQWCEQIGLPEAHRIDLSEFDSASLAHSVIDGLQNGFQFPALPVEKAVERSLSNWS